MRMERMLNNTAWGLSLVLGQASALLGLMMTVGWTLALAVVLPSKVAYWTGPRTMLPIGPPLIGLAVGALGLVIARFSREPISRFAIAGLLLNAVPLILTVVVMVLESLSR
jgi:hypothetical protein